MTTVFIWNFNTWLAIETGRTTKLILSLATVIITIDSISEHRMIRSQIPVRTTIMTYRTVELCQGSLSCASFENRRIVTTRLVRI